MGLPQLETCCFVFDLKTGNIIMGCLNAVFSFTLTILMIVLACMEPVDLGAVKLTPDIEAARTGLYVMTIILVFLFLAKFFFDLLFTYGVVTERPGIIKAYFIMWSVFFFLSMSTFFLNAMHYSASTIFMEVFYISVNVYAILLSHSFYKLLNTREEV